MSHFRDERTVRGVDDRHRQRTRCSGAPRQLDEIVAPPRLRDGEEQLALEPQLPPVDAGDVGRSLGDRNPDVALDQVLAEGRRMGRAAARAGDDDLRRAALEPPDKLCQRLRQLLRLLADSGRCFTDLARHHHVIDPCIDQLASAVD